jgi:hypothetical protein
VAFEYLKQRLQSRKWVSKEIIRGTMEEELSSSGYHEKVASG